MTSILFHLSHLHPLLFDGVNRLKSVGHVPAVNNCSILCLENATNIELLFVMQSSEDLILLLLNFVMLIDFFLNLVGASQDKTVWVLLFNDVTRLVSILQLFDL